MKRFIKVYLKSHYLSIFYYLLGLILFFENLNQGFGYWKWGVVSQEVIKIGITNPSLDWSLRSGSYSLLLFSLFWGFWVFSQVNQPRENGITRLLYCKPLKFIYNVNAQLITLLMAGAFLILISLYASNLLLILITDYQPDPFWVLLPPISGIWGIFSYTLFLYLLSLILKDWRSFIPIHFICWILLQSAFNIFSVDYQKMTNFIHPYQDSYLILKIVSLFALGLLFYITIKILTHLSQSGKVFSLKSMSLSSHFYKPKITLHTPIMGRLYYSLTIYYGWKLFFAGFSGLFIGCILAYKLVSSNLGFKTLLMIGQAIISLLGVLTTLHLAKYEEEVKTFTLIKRLPEGGIRTFQDKLIAMTIYFLLIVFGFTFPVLLIVSNFLWVNYLLALLPPFFFLIGIGYLTTLVTENLYIGYISSGGLWFIFSSLQRKIPYWLQPFFEIAEYKTVSLFPYYINKIVITVLAVSSFVLIGILEWRKFTKIRT